MIRTSHKRVCAKYELFELEGTRREINERLNELRSSGHKLIFMQQQPLIHGRLLEVYKFNEVVESIEVAP
jgi:hypothetical protein